MRYTGATRLTALCLLALWLAACSSPTVRPAPPEPAETPAPPAHTERVPGLDKRPRPVASGVTFELYQGPAGFFDPETARTLTAGDSVVVDAGSIDLDILLPGVAEAAAREAVRVTGASLALGPQWLQEGRLRFRLAPGKAGEQIEVAVSLPGRESAALTIRRAAPTEVTVDQRYGDGWQPVTILSSHAPPGPTTVRLLFSKPVRRQEVEAALLDAQSMPVRGLMEWENDQALIWHINELPPRLDFLLGAARDRDGLPLPGGIPSLRTGDPPVLVEAGLSAGIEQRLLTLPPDVLSASLTPDRRQVNLRIWTPGQTRWDWKTMDLHIDLPTRALSPGRADAVQPRLSGELENWVMNPQGTAVAGLHTDRAGSAGSGPVQADLAIMDLRGGRQQRIPGFLERQMEPSGGDPTPHLAWSADGLRIAGLSYSSSGPEKADLMVAEAFAGTVSRMASGLQVPASGTRLNWSPDQRWLLAGNLLVDLQSGTFRSLPGAPALARGVWEPGGGHLLYSTGDWGSLFLIRADGGELTPLGQGLPVGWAENGALYLIRWPGSDSRYLPPGF